MVMEIGEKGKGEFRGMGQSLNAVASVFLPHIL